MPKANRVCGVGHSADLRRKSLPLMASLNSGYVVRLCSPKFPLATSFIRKTLGTIANIEKMIRRKHVS